MRRNSETRPAHNGKVVVSVFLLIWLLCFLTIFYPVCVSAQDSMPDEREVVSTLLTEDWGKVADDLLGPVDTQTESPVLRLIKAHATLALNRNNESMCLFISASQDTDLKLWDEWTQVLIRRMPDEPLYQYFRGDALARQALWDEALSAFGRALKTKENHTRSMILNARGVVYAAREQFDNAMIDFINSSLAWPHLADAYANLGFLSILEMEGTRGALEDFIRARNASPDFSLARYGTGCVHMITGDLEKAEDEFDRALEQTGCLEERLLILISGSLDRHRQKKAVLMASVEGENPGFSVDSTIKAMNNNDLGWRGARYKKGLRDASIMGGKYLADFQKATKSYLRKSPDHAKYIRKYNHQLKTEMAMVVMSDKYKVGVTSGAGIKTGSNTKKSSLDFDLSSKLHNQIEYNLRPASEVARHSLSRLKNFDSELSRISPGYKNRSQGFDAAPSDGNIDEGWLPEMAEFGLLYRIVPE